MTAALDQSQKEYLLNLARQAITAQLNSQEPSNLENKDPILNQLRGVFVTLRKTGQLRGCLGNMTGTKPLYLEVRDMAIASASQDSRFKPVSSEELGDIKIEISVLSPLKQINNPDEIVLGKHGVLVRSGFSSGVYLPQVARETGWTKEEFMDSLCRDKARIATSAWKSGQCEIYIFSVELFSE